MDKFILRWDDWEHFIGNDQTLHWRVSREIGTVLSSCAINGRRDFTRRIVKRWSHKKEQKVYFAKAAGTARFVWNWALAELSDRVFLCQNPECAYHVFPQDRDQNPL